MVTETVRVAQNRVLMDWTVEIDKTPIKNLELTVPCLTNDGECQVSFIPTDTGVALTSRGRTVSFRWNPNMQRLPDDVGIANRNGIYRILHLATASGHLHLNASAMQ